MGVLGASATLWKVQDITLRDVKAFCIARGEFAGLERDPTAALDVSWLGIKAGSRGDPVGQILDLVRALTIPSFRGDVGFNVVLACDPAGRHHTKLASVQRAGKREESRIKAFHAKVDVMRLSTELRSLRLTEDERKGIPRRVRR